MKKITALIVDDETRSRYVLNTLIERHCSEVQVIGEAASAGEAFDLIIRTRPQLVFLDIQMPGSDGFTLLKQFTAVPFEVIFVTSFDKYAITAIKFSALDYLLKPVVVSDLMDAVQRAVTNIGARHNKQLQIINLLHSIEDKPETHRIAVHTSDSVIILEESAVISVEADGHYCTIRTDNGRFVTARTLRDFEEYFGAQSPFVRISRSQIINTKKMLKYSKGEPCMIEMINGDVFEVSRRRKTDVLNKLKKN